MLLPLRPRSLVVLTVVATAVAVHDVGAQNLVASPSFELPTPTNPAAGAWAWQALTTVAGRAYQLRFEAGDAQSGAPPAFGPHGSLAFSSPFIDDVSVTAVGAPPATTAPARYPLGYSDGEHERLARQATLLAPVTERAFREAGPRLGQHALDLGARPRVVSMIAARRAA